MIHWTELEMEFDHDGNPIKGEIVFSHVDDRTNEVRHFAVQRIEKAIRDGKLKPEIVECAIDPVFAAFSVRHRGIEPHRLERITPLDIAHYPITFAHMPGVGRDVPESEHLIIDGSHRYVAAAMLGWKTIRGYVLEPSDWEPFLIYVPELDDDTRRKMAGQAAGIPIDSRIP